MENVRPFPHQQADRDGLEEQLDAERFVLGTAMNQPHDIRAMRALITGGYFQRPAHEVIWTAILNLVDRGDSTYYTAVIAELDRSKELRRAGGTGYVTQVNDYVGGGDATHWAEKVRNAADLREAADLGRRIVQYATAPDAEPGQAVTFIDDYLQRQKERAAGRSGDPVDALLAELLDASSLDNMPALEPLVGDLLFLDSLARIIGPSGHMKSFVVIDIAGHVGTGMNWHGHHVRQGTVVYLVAEGAAGIRQRVRAWEKHHGLKMDNVLFLPRPVQTRGPEWDTWIEAMRRLEPALIVIDTQARVSVGVEENSNTELGIVVERLDDLRRATGACVLPIHHTGHIGEHGRGASAAKGALQSEMHVSKRGDNASNIVVTMKVGKQKDSEEGADLQFALKVVSLDGEFKPDGRPVTSVVLESLDLRPRPVEPNSVEWLVAVLDKADIPLAWGSPRVQKWCTEAKIQIRKGTIEDAVRFRKRRNSLDVVQTGTGDVISGAHVGACSADVDTRAQSLSDCSRNDLPPDLPRDLEHQTPPESGGTPGEFDQNRRSDIPPNTGGGPGDGPSKPPSPRSPSREGGGVGEDENNDTPNTPLCTICDRPMNTDWAARGYDTHLGCDPTTGSHPDAA
ncbi:AAA family ATPase [Streptomyces sp. NPDC048507]|uniref:AAA family ATPase n=1 Tax=Streptomyces sp. NPDC048507 TaxID=3365560 RepID=UPI0037166B19